MRPVVVVCWLSSLLPGCGGKAHFLSPVADAGRQPDAAADAAPAVDAGPDDARDAGVQPDAGCQDDADQDGVVSTACGGRDCNDADSTVSPRADDPGTWLFETADAAGWAVTPSVAVGPDAVAHLVFEDRMTHEVVHVFRTDEDEWSREIVEAAARAPAATFDAEGRLAVLFVSPTADPPEVRMGSRDPAGGWSTVTAVPLAPGHIAGRPALARGEDGVLVAAFADEGPDGAVVRWAAFDGAWTADDVAVDGGPVETTDGPVTLAVGPLSVPWLAWTAAGALRVARREAGAWTPETVPLAGPAAAPSVAVAPDGTVVVSFRAVDARAVAVARRASDGTWATETVDDRHGAGESSAVAVDRAGAVQLLYAAPDRLDMRWATDAWGGWLRVTLDRSAEADLALAVDRDGDGAVHMAYATSDSDLQWAMHAGGDGIDQDCSGLADDGGRQ